MNLRKHLPRYAGIGSASFFPRLAVIPGAACVASPPDPAVAEGGGSGHYLPGSIASFIDAVPLDETFIVRFNGLGVSAYDYDQLTPDSRTGATLGPFEGKSVGLGPVAS